MRRLSATPDAAVPADAVEPLEPRQLLSRAYGIDVSHYQGSINWSSVYASSKRFAWAKATEGTTYTDPNFKTYETGAPAAAVIAGAYHFARYDLGNSAAAEANHFLAVARPYLKAGYLRPVLDVEQATTMTTKALSAWVNTWCQTVLDATGCRPVVYTYTSFAKAHLNSTVTQWSLWMASYNGQNPQTGAPASVTPWSGWAAWQYGSGGAVGGIAGNVDVDVANGDLDTYVIPNLVNKSTKFAVGQTVKVTASSGLKAWNTYASNGTYVTKPLGTTAVVKGNPVFIAGYERWPLLYKGDTAVRWSAEDWLAPVATAAKPAAAKPAFATAPLSGADDQTLFGPHGALLG